MLVLLKETALDVAYASRLVRGERKQCASLTKESSSIFSSFDFVTYSHRVDIDVRAMLLFSKSALQLQKYERPSFYSSCCPCGWNLSLIDLLLRR